MIPYIFCTMLPFRTLLYRTWITGKIMEGSVYARWPRILYIGDKDTPTRSRWRNFPGFSEPTRKLVRKLKTVFKTLLSTRIDYEYRSVSRHDLVLNLPLIDKIQYDRPTVVSRFTVVALELLWTISIDR